jgi:integrase
MSCVWKSPKSRFWIAQFYDHAGKRRNRSTKSTDRRKAERIAEQYEDAFSRKRTARQVREVITKAHEEITGQVLANKSFADFSKTWLSTKKAEISPASLAFYTKAVEKFSTFLGPIAGSDMGELTREHILAFRNHESELFAPKTVNHDLKAIRMVFLAAKRDSLIADNPAENVKTVSQRGTTRSRRPFSIDEIRAVLSVADAEWKSMVLFGLYTGARLSDVAHLTWQNVDLTAKEVRYVARKTSKTLILPLAGALAEHVESLPASDNPSAALHPKAFEIVEKQGRSGHLSNQFADLLCQAGLRKKQAHRKTHGKGRGQGSSQVGLSFHCLRHTAVTLLKEAGIPQAVVMELVGHDSDEMSQHYTRVGKDALSGAALAFPSFSIPKAEGNL